MNDYSKFTRACFSAPHDDVPRLVWADYAGEAGDPALEYALRWCVAWGRRPRVYDILRVGGDDVVGLACQWRWCQWRWEDRTHSPQPWMLPRPVFSALSGAYHGLWDSQRILEGFVAGAPEKPDGLLAAYQALAAALAYLRGVTDAPRQKKPAPHEWPFPDSPVTGTAWPTPRPPTDPEAEAFLKAAEAFRQDMISRLGVPEDVLRGEHLAGGFIAPQDRGEAHP